MAFFDAPSIKVGKEDGFITKVFHYVKKRSKQEIPKRQKTPVKLISYKRVTIVEVKKELYS